jgi:uncharacterized membrane protein YkoI
MNKKILSMLVLGLLLGGGAVGAFQAAAQSSPVNAGQALIEDSQDDKDDNDRFEKPDTPITGIALEKASVAALNYLGQGKVTETEIEDEESYYEVEVTLDNGHEIDVQLDESFNVVGTDTD